MNNQTVHISIQVITTSIYKAVSLAASLSAIYTIDNGRGSSTALHIYEESLAQHLSMLQMREFNLEQSVKL
jgi:hypothetical protein